MKTLYIVTGILFLLLFLAFLIGKCRTYSAIKKVKSRTAVRKLQDLNEAVAPFGYCYEYTKDLFVTTLHPWQREMGYCRIYDESAVSMSMVIHCEPIEFEYGGMLYLIEFWKGQYGMTTGGEVGIYKAEKPENYEPGDFVFYQSISDREMPYIGMSLYKNGKAIVQRGDRHWWLTAFLLGTYSKPEELEMKIQIVFPNFDMQNAFIRALYDLGYEKQDILVSGLGVVVYFGTPATKQPVRKWKLLRYIAMGNNRFFCRRYLKKTKCFENSLDKIDYLRFRYPVLAGIALHFSKATEQAMRRSLRREGKKRR